MTIPEEEIQNLQQALDSGDKEKTLGIYRLLDIQGKLSDLPAQTLVALAVVLEQATMELESAHLLRMAAGKTANTSFSSSWRFRAACLLMGPAFRPEMALGVIRALLSSECSPEIEQKAQQLLQLHESGNLAALSDFLQKQGVAPPPAWSEENLETQAQSSGRSRSQFVTSKTTKGLSVAFFLGLSLWLLAAFMRDRLAGVENTFPQLNSEPKQVKVLKPKPIRLQRGDMNLTLAPLFDYHICGLVVSVNTYATLGLRYQDLFERDFCVIWGSNVSSGFYRAPGTTFEHHGNVCYSRWTGSLSLKGEQLSNNHIFALDDDLTDEIRSINTGDQICMDGQLVDVAAVPVRASPGHMPGISRMHTSTTRTDKGMGACEILLVKNLSVLARANTGWHILATAGFWLALASLLAILFSVFFKK